MSLVAELRRRSVFKVGAAYLVVGWLVVQAASIGFPAFDAPPWALRVFIFAVLLAFPLALMMAWLLQVTPEGVKVETAPVGNRRFFAAVAVMAALAVAWYYLGQPAIRGAGDDAAARTIAVLPFVNMSGDAGNEYFSDGISEEILNVLARTPELQVAARTSSFAFKGQNKEVPEIAQALRVRMVLEGSVRRQGERVRITAQLIDAETGFHLWSQTYDRELKDIFAIQDDIARAIGAELKVKIIGVEHDGGPTRGTSNLEAYDLYLRGLGLWQTRREQDLWDAIALFERAVEQDPEFAQAHAGLALVYAVLFEYTARITAEDSFARGLDAAERALALDPALPEAYAALGSMAGGDWRRETGVALLKRAIALRPSYATAHQWLGTSLMSSGDMAQSLAQLERASALDPRSGIIAANHAWMLMISGRNADAIAVCERILELVPDADDCLRGIALAHLLEGRRDAARSWFERVAGLRGPGDEGEVAEYFAALEGRGDPHDIALRLKAAGSYGYLDLATGHVFSGLEIPALLILLREEDLIFDFIEGVANGDSGATDWGLLLPALDPVRCAPRFVTAARTIRLKDPHAARVCAAAN